MVKRKSFHVICRQNQNEQTESMEGFVSLWDAHSFQKFFRIHSTCKDG